MCQRMSPAYRAGSSALHCHVVEIRAPAPAMDNLSGHGSDNSAEPSTVDMMRTSSYPLFKVGAELMKQMRKNIRRQNADTQEQRGKDENNRSSSVRQKAYRHIQRLIASGGLVAGSGVSELTLAKELASSRTPIREAMNQLAAEGLLEQSPGGGMIVARFERDDIIELYDVREALEVFSVGRIATLPLRPADRDQLQMLIDEIPKLKEELERSGESALNASQMERFLACDLGFHALLMSMTQNRRIQKIVNETRLLIRIFSLKQRGLDANLLHAVKQYHQRVLDAITNHDRELAMQAISEHIQASQREQLNEFDRHRREESLLEIIPALFRSI